MSLPMTLLTICSILELILIENYQRTIDRAMSRPVYIFVKYGWPTLNGLCYSNNRRVLCMLDVFKLTAQISLARASG